MKAIIAPLNEYFFNYEKYDGLNSLEKYFIKKHPSIFNWLISIQKQAWVKKVFQSAIFSYLLIPLIAIAVVILVTRIHIAILPQIITNFGKKDYFKIINKELQRETDKIVEPEKDLQKEVSVYKEKGYQLLIYYSPKLIPKDEEKRQIFFKKLEGLKKELGVLMVFEASNDSDIEEKIKELNIDISKSYFVKGEGFDLISTNRLNTSTP